MAKPDFGIDAPGLLRGFVLAACAGGLVLAGMLASSWVTGVIGATLATLIGLITLYASGMATYMIYGSKVAKLRDRDLALAMIDWRGDEQVLDVGCGRGLMAIGAAARLTSGRAIGIDIWQASDQAGNRPEALIENARRCRVSDRVEVRTADMRTLPFADGQFDVILSNWAVHNLADADDRATALREMARVLTPEGVIVLADIANRNEYRARLESLGLADQKLLVHAMSDRVLKIVTFGSFAPATIIARR